MDIWIDVGLFQLEIGSTFIHVLDLTKLTKESLSLGLLYCLNNPSLTLKGIKIEIRIIECP